MYVQTFHLNATTNATTDAFLRLGANWNYQATITGTGAVSATVTIQGSNDGTTWATIGSAISLSGTGSAAGSTNATIPWRHHRSVITSITGTGATVNCIGVGE